MPAKNVLDLVPENNLFIKRSTENHFHKYITSRKIGKFSKTRPGLDKSNSQWCTFTYSCFTLFVPWRTSILKYLYVIRKRYVTCISREHKPFYQLRRLNDFNINTVANLFVLEKPKIPKRYSGSRHLDGAFCKNSWWLKVINYFCKKVHLRFSNGLWIRPCILLPRNFLCTFRKWSFTEKMLRKFRNEFLQMYGET